MIASAAVIPLVVLFALAPVLTTRSSCMEGEVEIPCPTGPRGPDGRPVADEFFFANRTLGENGSITARMTSMAGIITYPPPDHDEIVSGLVPWAKAGIIIKDGVEQGSSYAALMMTGDHGVRMQHDYVHDTAGEAGFVSAESPRWLRLTRAGDTITGYESADGREWSEVDTVRLPGLPEDVRVGLFATSPGDLTLLPVALGARLTESRFTQATGVFDNVALEGADSGGWNQDIVGESDRTDWEKYHRAAGLVEGGDGSLTVTGSGDIGPIGTEGGTRVESTLGGLAVALTVLIAVSARFAAARGDVVARGRVLAARAVVVAAVAFVSGLIATAIAVPVSTAVLVGNGLPVVPAAPLTEVRVIVGAAGVLAAAAVFALALGALLRRWAALVTALSAVVLAYLLAVLPLLPVTVSEWLLRVTPAAGFSVLQTSVEYPQVTAHYAPYLGYFPLPWWLGFAILCGYASLTLWGAVRRAGTRA